ncbi:hypothetical protein SC1083_2049 [Aggregatibacter actinomycetemcomitans serotype e str. SC1083]|uniref:Uncharacterized protein n=1 Tax=Aggregatibacter actinomycetemcomitans serotype e str. SC1083 TaxID=907488 RepID=G4AB19_AGGAC|nr:hypothetical protein SC1083_2049 [Aggregatibacter actinomycetemcomitans serotype e str. SC1083]
MPAVSQACRICRARASVTAIMPVWGRKVLSQSVTFACSCAQFCESVLSPK